MDIDSKMFSKSTAIFSGIAVILTVTFVGVWWILSPSWVPVFGANGTQEARLEAVKKLMEWNVPYKEDDATGFVLVKGSEALAIRSRLSALGVLNAGDVGFELFSKNDYGMSEFTQRINYQRALEGELSRTIRSFADVRQARVHLSVPKESIFKDKQLDTKASVVIETRPGQMVSQDQVFGISKLVAGSVPNLESENVIVLDEQGKVLSANGNERNNQKHYTARNIEISYTEKARDLVAGIAQTSDIQVAVNAKVNFDKVKSVKDQIIPDENGSTGFLSRIKRQSRLDKDAASSKGEEKPENILLEEEYLYTRERSEIEYAMGQIESVSVGVVVVKELSESMLTDIEKVVASGLGLVKSRGDRITVVSIPPSPIAKGDQSPVRDREVVQNETPGTVWREIKSLPEKLVFSVIGLVTFLLLLVLFLLFRTVSRPGLRVSAQEREKLLQDIREWAKSESQEGIVP